MQCKLVNIKYVEDEDPSIFDDATDQEIVSYLLEWDEIFSCLEGGEIDLSIRWQGFILN